MFVARHRDAPAHHHIFSTTSSHGIIILIMIYNTGLHYRRQRKTKATAYLGIFLAAVFAVDYSVRTRRPRLH